jgi:hypothetical protein
VSTPVRNVSILSRALLLLSGTAGARICLESSRRLHSSFTRGREAAWE